MLRILGKDVRISKSTTMVARSESSMETYDVLEDMSSWEFVNPSDDELEDSYSFSDDTDDELTLKEEERPCEIGSPSSDISVESPSPVQMSAPILVYNFGVHYDDDDDVVEEEEDYDDDGCELDDELVPKWLSDKFERQRIRKLGKRGGSRMKSKKGPYIFNRPGCVHGKHGFGVQHSYI